MKEIYFNTKDLAVGYKGKILIRDIDIQIKKGEILTLIGPNGSGKSTILKSITKHLTAIRGDTFIADASVAHMNYKELSKLVAVVLADRLRPELMTCRDVVSTGRYPYTGNLGILSEEDEEKVSCNGEGSYRRAGRKGIHRHKRWAEAKSPLSQSHMSGT